jgi:ATP adenylyltransferase
VSYEQIWAPWRLAYIEQPTEDAPQPRSSVTLAEGADPACFLCQGAEGPDARGRHVIQRTARVVTLLNRYPYNNGHLLVAPKRHCAKLDELACEEQLELSQVITRMVNLLTAVLHPEGFNVGLNLGVASGAGLPGHLHWHIVPRWNGDTNFMLTTASTKVIPQALGALWDALTSSLNEGPRECDRK